ncbi:type II toxin-antitoxin system RelE/ParE family toxin [Limnofasciculus baicalensis]|uniref:Type II toxin-antitoxin system RelE/ParE family toxin n=1 Tax=Limnofasciculus baicalensis BBK-W-15 TaxID=2699891 RepID=A0AAE3GVN7_9CYAN|nr:type II toxin-antitoxin system RelE/ParE family toxin [Limnofasciculus baicalensis]MCP2731214.1 type II toxin-antitoxin system RelE/ParE family toxin [Limnofasciculus baicalensis BBK-W-15]
MIKTIRHKGLKQFYEKSDTSKIQPQQAKRLRLILGILKRAKTASDMNFPGSELHSLSGNLKGFWSVKVSGNWRIIFRIEEGDVYDVDYLDYH